MRVLITGASGFIGKNLLPLLHQHEVLILSRSSEVSPHSNFSYLQCDLAQLDSVRKQLTSYAPEIFIHLAWEGLPDYSLKTCLHNFNLSVNLVRTMGDLGCRKIFISGSCWEYGDVSGEVREEDIPGNTGLFASFKTSLRLVAESLSDEYHFDLIWGRIFFVYGPGQRDTSLIPSCINSFHKNQVPDIRTPGTINDFIYVKDVANSILTLIESPEAAGIYNIASGTPRTVAEVVKLIAEILGKTSLLDATKKDEQGHGFWGNISAIQDFIPNQIQMPLNEGIKRLLKEDTHD